MATEREKLRDLVYDWKLGKNKLSPGDVMAAIDAYAANYTPKPAVAGDGELQEIVRQIWQVVKKDSMASSAIGHPAQYTVEKLTAMLADVIAAHRPAVVSEGELRKILDKKRYCGDLSSSGEEPIYASVADVLNDNFDGDVEAELLAEITAWHASQAAAAQERAVEQNKSFCGCSMCPHHTEAYAIEKQRQNHAS